MKLEMIKAAIKLFDSTRDKPDALISLYKAGSCFEYTYNGDFPDQDVSFIHAYLGVLNDSLNLFLIDSRRDTEEQHNTEDGLLPFIQVVDVMDDFIPARIEDRVDPIQAQERIEKWKQAKDDWIIHQNQNNIELHQIFAIPTNYLTKGESYIAYFALHKKMMGPDERMDNYKGDMIVWDKKDEALLYPANDGMDGYFNTVRLSPPFGEEKKDRNNFFLLKLSTQTS